MTEPAQSSTPDPSSTPAENNSGWTPPATQQELNRIISERVQRERAKFADYEELKTAAALVGELNEKVAAAEAEKADVPAVVAQQLRSHLVALHEIEQDDADLFLTASDPETLLKQVDRLVGRSKKHGNHVPREGSSFPTAGGDERQAVRSIFGGSD